MLKLVIVDDEPLAIRALLRLLQEVPDVCVAGTADTVEDALHVIQETKPDVVLLDVDLGSNNGFELFSHLRPAPKIIFVTGSPQHAVAAFAVAAADYLLKPVIAARLEESLKRVRRQIAPVRQDKTPMIALGSPGRAIFSEADDIAAVAAEGDFARVYLAGQPPLLILRTLNQFEAELPETSFLRLSRSLIVNLDRVRRHDAISRDSSNLVLEGLPQSLQLGRTATERLRRALRDRTSSRE